VTTATAQRAVPQQINDLQYLLGRLEARGKDVTGTRAKLNDCWRTDLFTVEFATDMIRLLLDLTEELDQAEQAAIIARRRADVESRPTILWSTSLAAPPVGTANLSNVETGRYAVRTNADDEHYAFYRVWKGDRATLVYLLASDNEQCMPRPAARTVLAKIAEDPYEAACAYGREIGVCGRCGITLTNAESIARGMGDICASKF
jgi:hypothetical protein